MEDQNEQNISYWSEHKFLLMVGGSVVVSFIMVIVSMMMYTQSGTAQLDLSRPGYRSLSGEAPVEEYDFQGYPSTGEVSSSTLEEFDVLFEKEASNIREVDAFAGDPLNPATLGIDTPIEQ